MIFLAYLYNLGISCLISSSMIFIVTIIGLIINNKKKPVRMKLNKVTETDTKKMEETLTAIIDLKQSFIFI